MRSNARRFLRSTFWRPGSVPASRRGSPRRIRPTRASCLRHSSSHNKEERGAMLNRSKLAAVGLLAAVFLAGGLAGWGGREATERDGYGPRGRGPDALVAYLSRELDLSAAQRDSVRAIFARHRPETDALWAQVRPRFDSIKARMRAEIDVLLTPDQRVKHQRLIDRAEHHRREREDSTKGKAGGQH